MLAEPLIYWDSCVLISYVEAVPGRVEVLDELLAQAERGDVRIVTSVVSQVEVAYQRGEESDNKIRELWKPASPITLVEFHDLIAEDARVLIRKARARDLRLTPLDAIHIATSARHTSEMHTYDEGLPRHSSDADIPIHKPRTGQLPLGADPDET